MLLSIENLSKTYIDVNNKHLIFSNLNLNVDNGEDILLLGNSGCGKSTLLQIIGLIQNADSGIINVCNHQFCYKNGNIYNCIFNEKNLEKQKTTINKSKKIEKIKNKLLRNDIGFIYQFHYLFNDFTAIENLIIPQLIKKISFNKAKEKAEEMLKLLNISHRKEAMPYELSGGERQRIAIARAIIKEPKIILADEPTGNLDEDMSNIVVNEMIDIVKKRNISLIMVSHNRSFKNRFDKTYQLTQNGLVLL